MNDLYSGVIEVEADTVAEALRSLALIPELLREDGSPHPVKIEGIDSDIALFSQSSMTEIHVFPRLGGAGGRGGILQILIGIVLIVVAVMVPGLAFLGMPMAGQLLLGGALMVLGGILQLLLPAPETGTENNQSSKYLGASGNTVQIGTRIALIYGTRRKSGHFLSFDVDAVEVAPNQGTVTPLVASSYFEHDKTTPAVPLAPVNPVYASSVTSPTNVPISSWRAFV